jgi:hypothetical protein
LIERLQKRGNQIIGSTHFPLDGAEYIFHSKDEKAVLEFMRDVLYSSSKKDPYTINKLVIAQEYRELE